MSHGGRPPIHKGAMQQDRDNEPIHTTRIICFAPHTTVHISSMGKPRMRNASAKARPSAKDGGLSFAPYIPMCAQRVEPLPTPNDARNSGRRGRRAAADGQRQPQSPPEGKTS